MPKETSTTAHPELADLADSLGYTKRRFARIGGAHWWDLEDGSGRLRARLVVSEADGFEVHAFVGAGLVAWSVQLTASTPGAVLAAAMAVAAEGTR